MDGGLLSATVPSGTWCWQALFHAAVTCHGHGHVTRWVTAEENGRKERRRRTLAASLFLVAASLVEPVATQGPVAAAYLPDYRLNGADCISPMSSCSVLRLVPEVKSRD